ncbi:MAG: ABC transporter permease subunit [Candidatus Poseidoniaceae archaeon]|jgi:ABC-type transport system involved in multi-copper enzyme maturation permease subunit|tara:strand:- start:2324 stop:3154 length:831 start_codon:yes stop_codon:yes gene_type:complete
MNHLLRIKSLSTRVFWERIRSTRMAIMFPILVLFLPGMAWGFSDPNIVLPGGHQPEGPMEIMFYASLGVVFGATMCGVMLAFDGVSRDRASGVFELRLAQPMPRTHQAIALMLGMWQAIFVPVALLILLSFVIIRWRLGEWAALSDVLIHLSATGLILFWYVVFTLLASSRTKDQGTAVAFGIGMWFLFTFLWALVTTMVAYASGVAIGEQNDAQWVALEGALDLLSPNGVYHHILETRLEDVDRGVAAWQAWVMALLWSVLPTWWFVRRMNDLQP